MRGSLAIGEESDESDAKSRAFWGGTREFFRFGVKKVSIGFDAEAFLAKRSSKKSEFDLLSVLKIKVIKLAAALLTGSIRPAHKFYKERKTWTT